jgi:predicted transcriptional regulator of viral defense system
MSWQKMAFAVYLQHTLALIVNTPVSSFQEAAVLELAKLRPLLRARDLAEHALPTIVLSRLVAVGKLERVGRGIYSLPGRRLTESSSLAEVCLRVPNGVICLLTALRFHDIGTQAPFEIWIAIPHKAEAPRIDTPSLRVVRMSGSGLEDGVDRKIIEGVNVPVFNLARTVVDCFKFRNKIGLDVALETLRDAWGQGRLSMTSVEHYARAARMSNVMRPYLQSVAAE